MRIVILTTQCPFVVGGAELHARSLERVLREEGHEAEIVTMPFKWYPSTTILDHMLAARSLDVSEYNGAKIDLAICLKFPAYLMQHPNKTFWVLHQHRQTYDLWDSGHSDLFDDENGQFVREAIRAADNAEFSRNSRIFANSANVAKRLLDYNNVVATPLYHPPPLADRLSTGEFGDYFYYPSRITPSKRQEFVLRSLALSDKKVRVVFSGAPDNPGYGQELVKLAHDLGVADRIEWRGYVSDKEMIALYAGARGVVFTPIDEDLGYIALEAMLAGKPLLTLSDAGEPATLVRNEVEGLVVNPEPSSLAQAMNRLMSKPEAARNMGTAGLERYHALDISWANVVAALTTNVSVASSRVPSERMDIHSHPKAPNRFAAIDSTTPAAPWPGPTLDALAERYVFGDHLIRHRDYYETHWPRYQATLDALLRTGINPLRILELGTSSPYVFTAFLKQAFPKAEFRVVQESPAGLSWSHKIIGQEAQSTDIDIEVFGLNVETTSFPFRDGEFDLVIAMEMLEHFAIDPSFVFRESRRVLREGGAFIVTTPNLISLPGLHRALGGGSPYSFGVFVPWNGAYGRHNREYTPHEVESLARYAGFETALLETSDVYRQDEIPSELPNYMREQGYPLSLRGQNIFYVGLKASTVPQTPFPANLFPIDPAILSGAIELQRATEGEDGFIVKITNVSPTLWLATGPQRMRLTVDRVDQNGLVTLDAQSFDLARDVAAGSALEIPIKAIKGSEGAECWHEIGLYLEGAGPLKGAGRIKTVSVFAQRLQAAPELQCDDDAT